MSLPVPRVVVHQGTRYGLVVCEQNGITYILSSEEGIYDIIEAPSAGIEHEYPGASDVSYLGRIMPTVEHFLNVMSKSLMSMTQRAIDAIKEMQIVKTIVVSNVGKLLSTATPQSVILTSDKPLAANLATLTAALGERALGAFVTGALSPAKPVAKCKKDDPRIAEALTQAFKGDGATEAAIVAAQGKARKTAPAAAADKVEGAPGNKAGKTAKEPKEPRKPGSKLVIHDFLMSGGVATFDEFITKTGSSEGSVRTALTDLKNAKYGVGGKAIDIQKTAEGGYFVPGTWKGAVSKAPKASAAVVVAAEKPAKAAKTASASAPATPAPGKPAKAAKK